MKGRQLHIENGDTKITYLEFESQSNEDISIKGFGINISTVSGIKKSDIKLTKLLSKIIPYYEFIMKIITPLVSILLLLLPNILSWTHMQKLRYQFEQSEKMYLKLISSLIILIPLLR